jgi:hypothetical protein
MPPIGHELSKLRIIRPGPPEARYIPVDEMVRVMREGLAGNSYEIPRLIRFEADSFSFETGCRTGRTTIFAWSDQLMDGLCAGLAPRKGGPFRLVLVGTNQQFMSEKEFQSLESRSGPQWRMGWGKVVEVPIREELIQNPCARVYSASLTQSPIFRSRNSTPTKWIALPPF